MELPEYLRHIGIQPGHLIAGFFGGVAHVLSSEGKNIAKSIALVISGMATTVYLTPVVVDKFNLAEEGGYGAAFIIGILGMYIVGGVIKIGQLFYKDPFTTLLGILNLKKRS